MKRPVDVVLDFLRAEEARGVTHVHLDEQARAILRGLAQRSRQGARTNAARGHPTAPPVPPVSSAPSAPSVPTTPPGRATGGLPVASGATPAERIASLAAQAEHWQPARGLGTLRDTMVFSVGNPEADLMLVGEAPGYQEELQRQPFVGPAGQLLDRILLTMGLGRPQVYISNIVKFRPKLPNQTSNNRKPTIEEMAACLPFVRAEVGVVRPRCIVALGATAAEGLLGLSGPVGAMRGKWHSFEGIPARVTYHPAYLLHGSGGHREKRLVWEDMLEVMEKLGMQVSGKQRGFFLPKD